jgi:hypothetical protein
VTAHLEANMPCEAIVAAFSKNDGTLANGWLPAIVRLEEREEQTGPVDTRAVDVGTNRGPV